MSILEQKFSTQEVCKVTGVDPATIQNWIRRGHIVGHRDENPIEGGGAQGKRRLFSWFAMMQIAVAGRLIETGCKPGQAFRAAASFAHSGSGRATWFGEDPSGASAMNRHPGIPYHHSFGRTILVLQDEEAKIVLAKDGMLNVQSMHRRASAMIVFDLLAIFEAVTGQLGAGHPFAILDDLYGGVHA